MMATNSIRHLRLFGGGLLLALLAGSGGACRSGPEGAAAAPKPPDVTISQVVQRSVTDYDQFTGRMEAVESVDVRARVRGYLNTVHFVDGQEVKAGAPLFDIDPRTFEAALKDAEGQKAQWVAKRLRAQADVTRYEGLVPTGAASAQDLDKARADLGESNSAIQSAEAAIDRAKLDLEFSRLTAPIDGQVGRALITKGNLVQAGGGADSLLTSIVSLNPMYVYFPVNERSLLRFRKMNRPGSTAGGATTVADLKIPVGLGLLDETGFPHNGVIDFADNRIDPDTGTIRVRASFDNSDRAFKPGFFARIRVPMSSPYDALLVSQTAIGTEQGQKYVLVVNDQSVVEKRFVATGSQQDDGLQAITEGLRPGEWIVVNGIQRCRPGRPVTPQRAEMPVLRKGAHSSPATSRPADSTSSASGSH